MAKKVVKQSKASKSKQIAKMAVVKTRPGASPAKAKKAVSKQPKTYMVKDKLIESWEEACKVTGKNPKLFPITDHLPPEDRQFPISSHILGTIYQAQNINDGFVPDPTNPNQWKFTYNGIVKKGGKHPSGFVFSDSLYDDWITYAIVGARLCVKNGTRAIELGEKFPDLHLDIKFPVAPKRNTKKK